MHGKKEGILSGNVSLQNVRIHERRKDETFANSVLRLIRKFQSSLQNAEFCTRVLLRILHDVMD